MSEYLDGELNDAACTEIRKHLLECPSCKECFESLKKTVDLCNKLPDQTIPEEIGRRLRVILRDCLDKSVPGARRA